MCCGSLEMVEPFVSNQMLTLRYQHLSHCASGGVNPFKYFGYFTSNPGTQPFVWELNALRYSPIRCDSLMYLL